MSNPWREWDPSQRKHRERPGTPDEQRIDARLDSGRDTELSPGSPARESPRMGPGQPARRGPLPPRGVAAYLFLPLLPLMGALFALMIPAWRFYTVGSPERGSEYLFWSVGFGVPLLLLAATWIRLRNPAQQEASDEQALSMLATLRFVLVYAVATLFFAFAIVGWICALLALTDCALRECGGVTTYRWSIFGVTAASALLPALLLTHLALRKPLYVPPRFSARIKDDRSGRTG